MDLNKIECHLADLLNKTLKIPSLPQKLTNPTFSCLIKKEIDILIFLEKKNNSNNEASASIVKTFNSLSKTDEFVVNHDFSYEISDLDDDINSLRVFVMNLFSVDLETYDPSKEKPKAEKNSASQSNGVSPQVVIPETIRAQINGFEGDSYKNAFYSTTAQMRLSSEIREGKVFAFDNRPKIIPIIKIIAGSILAMSAIVSLLLSMFLLMANQAITGITDDKFKNYQTTWPAMICFVYGLLFGYGGWNMIQPLFSKAKRNENKIYRLNWQPYLFIGFLFLVSLMLEYMTSPSNGSLFDLIKSMANNPANANIKMAIEGWYILGIWSFINLGLAAAVIALGIFYNPKFDHQKLNDLVKTYIDELVSSSKK